MHKNTHANVSTLSAIAISAILLTSFTMIGMQYLPHAMAQTNSTSAAPSANMTSPSGNATGAAPSGNASSSSSSSGAATSANATSAQEPPIGQSFVLTGTKSSQESPLPGHTKDQVVGILIPRTDNAVYSGVLTYTASKGANVEVWNDFNPGNSSAIPKTFGSMKTSEYQGKPVAIVDLSPSGGSGSVPFSGKAILLHATSPFTVTYTVNAVAQTAQQKSDVKTAMALATPPAPKALLWRLKWF
ncbi:hypothetical protein [Nitrososphaera sp. AFS]|uniref:hypothetical protein n=1 Tax=Nitrososphaera sp. AFS TaxID=2301191 RepID=UPI0013923DA8|nr:hypothetical protein [Nitrososphaera sp. AFS]NAL77123.1 hypothetical protein [Nitrososphaera sp. AFS]